MSDFIRIICNSTESIFSAEVANFILEGVYFDDTPRFDPPQESGSASAVNWQTLAVYYQEGRRPLLFHKSTNDQLMLKEVKEIIEEELADKQGEAAASLRRRLLISYQTIAIEINPTTTTEEAWEMLDNIEAYLAGKYDGIIYVPDDGFFNASLQKIALS